MGIIKELPIASPYTTDQSIYLATDATAPTNALLYNLISMDGRLISRPGFTEKFSIPLQSGEKILHIGVDNEFLIVVTPSQLRVVNLLNNSIEHTVDFKTQEEGAAGTAFYNAYVVVTHRNGFFIVDRSTGTLDVRVTASIPGPIPYTNAKVIGATVVSYIGSLLCIGGLYIQPQNGNVFLAESYILRSTAATSSTLPPVLPVTITDTTFDLQRPLIIGSRGRIVDLINFANSLVLATSDGSTFLINQISASNINPFIIKQLSSALGSAGTNSMVVLENLVYTLSTSSIARIAQSGQIQRVGEQLRSFILDRDMNIQISSAINRRFQSIMWKISSKHFTRSNNVILCCNYESFETSILGLSTPPFVIEGIVQATFLNQTYVLIADLSKSVVRICILDHTSGTDNFIGEKPIPIAHAIHTPAIAYIEQKGLQSAGMDPYRVTICASSPAPLKILTKKICYLYTEKNSDLWASLSDAVVLDRLTTPDVFTGLYSANLGFSTSSIGTFIAFEIVETSPFSLEYAAAEFAITA